MLLSKLVRSARVARGMSVAMLAASCGVSASHISRIEGSDSPRCPSPRLLRALARALELDPDALHVAARRMPDDIVDFLLANPDELARLRARVAA